MSGREGEREARGVWVGGLEGLRVCVAWCGVCAWSVCMSVCVCVCVCVRERESVCVCVCERERERGEELRGSPLAA